MNNPRFVYLQLVALLLTIFLILALGPQLAPR